MVQSVQIHLQGLSRRKVLHRTPGSTHVLSPGSTSFTCITLGCTSYACITLVTGSALNTPFELEFHGVFRKTCHFPTNSPFS